ncbi:MAG: threonylcarbamoyl-AMP synthase [Chloroflexi bacterium]|nr:threonylcarbamoyl-AMP synthase [Chloroflexota bacterium]
MNTVILPAGDPAAVAQAIDLLHQGEVIAFPTDTVYGLGCNAWQPEAVARLYKVKERPREMAIPLLISGLDRAASQLALLNPAFRALADAFWPGELTLVAASCGTLPEIVTAGKDTVALRMPDHVQALELCAALGGALAVTSANRSGSVSGVSAQQVYDQLAGRIPLILDGGVMSGGVASTIVDCTCTPPRVLRQGALSLEALNQVTCVTGG